jgi:two-component system, NarL family, response regulator NreC
MNIRIFIVDDHILLRAGIKAFLKDAPGIEVVGDTGRAEEAIQLAEAIQPDVVLLDISMPGMGGIEATHQIINVCPNAHVLILTVHEDVNILREAIQAGAAGYILKRAVEAELVSAIQAVARGDLYIYPAMTRALLIEKTKTPTQKSTSDNELLTGREMDVLRLIVRGHTNREIANLLNLSVRTIETHRANMLNKLGLHSRVDLVQYATEHNLFEEKD